jgi:hypothetical protein
MGRTACTEPQCLYSRAIPLIPLWAVGPVQSLCLYKGDLFYKVKAAPQCATAGTEGRRSYSSDTFADSALEGGWAVSTTLWPLYPKKRPMLPTFLDRFWYDCYPQISLSSKREISENRQNESHIFLIDGNKI